MCPELRFAAEMESGEACVIEWMYLMPLNYTLNCEFYVMCIL